MDKKFEPGTRKDYHSQIFGRQEFDPAYLDSFNHEEISNSPQVSVVIPTYNRAPHPVVSRANPLGWCLESLSEQRYGNIGEIIVIDDGSQDYTRQVVEDQKKRLKADIVFIRNEINRGSSIGRNIGVEKSKYPLVQFVDDDCVFSPWMMFGSNYTLKHLPENAAAVHLPVYHRNKKPNKIVNTSDIGVLDFDSGNISGNFNGFPREYLDDLESYLMDPDRKILKPIQIDNLGGVFLVKKDDFEATGGFPEYFTWKNAYREETNVAINLAEIGKSIFFTPDPKFYCVHLKYGSQSIKNGKGNYNGLSEFVNESNVEAKESGNRVPQEDWVHAYIASTFLTLSRGNKEISKAFSLEVKKRFVYENDYSVFSTSSPIEKDGLSSSQRSELYDRAMADGEKLIEKRKKGKK